MLRIREFFKDATQNHFFGATSKLDEIDVAIIFGNKFITEELANALAEDYKTRRIKHIIVCGGILTHEGQTEADAIADVLIHRHNIPADIIFKDTQSTNTCENAAYARDLLKEIIGDQPPSTIIGYGHIKAGMRFLWTLEKFFPSSVSMFQQVWPHNFAEQEPSLSQTIRSLASQQVVRLPFYAAMHYIKPVTLAVIEERIQKYDHRLV